MELQAVNGCMTVDCSQWKIQEDSVVDLKVKIAHILGLDEAAFYLTNGGKLIRDGDISKISGSITVVPRLLGGKGGFGSMLRAIGAQIEKTTNRDACRDLSGRRLRDINEEQRLKRWFAKQGEREQEKKEARKRKLEKLKQFTEGPPLPVIDDPEYNQQRADMADKVYAAVDKGFEADVHGKASGNVTATSVSDESSSDSLEETKTNEPTSSSSASEATDNSASGPSASTKAVATSSGSVTKKKTIKKLMMDEEFDSCTSSDESGDEEINPKKAKLQS